MAGGVSDGQAVNAAVTDAAFLHKNAAEQMPAQLDYTSTAPADGPFLISIQKNVNSIFSFVGASINQIYNLLPTWATTNRGLSNNNVKQRVEAIDTAFDPSSGHKHSGVAGDAPPIAASSVSSVPLMGYATQGTDLVGVVGTSTNVSAQFTGFAVSTNTSTPGVVVNAPYNKIILRNSANDQEFLDGSGNVVYGRLTNSGAVWTLSYYSEVSGTETPYSFLSSGVRFYYQVLASPLGGTAPVYSELFFVPSSSATADVLTATTTTQGKVQLATAAQDVSSTTSAGTANATVANADHTHRGVASLKTTGNPLLYGGVILDPGTGVTFSQVGNTITVNSSGSGGAVVYEDTFSTLAGVVNGSNTVFTLSQTPMGGNTPMAVIDGIAQFTNTFTVVGSTLTFGIAPELGQTPGILYTVTAGGGGGSASYVVYGSTGAPIQVAAASTVAVSSDARQLRFLSSTGGNYSLSSTPQVTAGSIIGQELTLRGTSATNYIILADGNGLSLNGPCSLTNNQTLELVYDGSVWAELSRRG